MRNHPIAFLALMAAFSTVTAAEASKDAPLQWEPLHEPCCGGCVSSLAISPHDGRRVLVGGDMLGAGLSEDGGETWQSTFGFSNWEIADFTFHPREARTVWAGTMGGPYRSADGGRNWQVQRSGLPPASDRIFTAPIQKVLFDPNDARRLLAFGGSHRGWFAKEKPLWGAVWESRDGGGHWQQIATIGGGANIGAAAFGAGRSDVVYVAARASLGAPGQRRLPGDNVQGGVYVSRDGGKTWTARNQGLPHTEIHRLVCHPRDSETLWVALGTYQDGRDQKIQTGGIFRSTDGGATWTPCLNGLSQEHGKDRNRTSSYRTLAVAPSDPKILLTADVHWGVAKTYRSVDGGDEWQPVFGPRLGDCAYADATGAIMSVIEFDPSDARVAFMANSANIVRTRDGGKSWADVTCQHHDAARPGRWRGRGYSGLCTVDFAFNPLDPRHAVILAMDDGKFWQSRDQLRSWRWAGEGIDHNGGGNGVTFAGPGGKTMYATFGQHDVFRGIAKTTDGGQTWKLLAGPARGLPEIGHSAGNGRWPAAGVYALPGQPEVVWATAEQKLYHSTDGGERWRVVHDGPVGWIAALPDVPRSFYLTGGEKGIYFTSDGERFQLLPRPNGSPRFNADPWNTRITLDRQSPPRLYVAAGYGSGLWRWEEAGGWTQLKADRYISNVAVDPTDSRRIAVSTEWSAWSDVTRASGVWTSEDGGDSWKQQNGGLPCLRGRVIAINPHDPEQLIFGSDGRGYFVTCWPKRK